MAVKIKNIHIIINPASGQVEPILHYISAAFKGTRIKWDITITRKAGDAKTIAQDLVGKVDAIAVYGGDGTVIEVAQAIFQTPTPMMIIPGGTANVMAKEVGLPINSLAALELIRDQALVEKEIDVGLINKQPFFMRITIGLLAVPTINNSRSLKNRIGEISYTYTLIKDFRQPQLQFKLEFQNSIEIVEGVSLVIANSGNIGLPGVSLLPGIDIADGNLDIVLLQRVSMPTFIRWGIGMLFKERKPSFIRHWRARKFKVTVFPSIAGIRDDVPIALDNFTVDTVPKAIKLLVPNYGGEQS